MKMLGLQDALKKIAVVPENEEEPRESPSSDSGLVLTGYWYLSKVLHSHYASQIELKGLHSIKL